MTEQMIKSLEKKLSIVEFKLELVLKLSKTEINLTLEESKTMDELAFVVNLNKEEYLGLEKLLTSQIEFYKSCNQKSYLSPRQFPKLESDLDVFTVLSKEEYENAVWECIPSLNGNVDICKKIAKINGIYDLYYDNLATEIKNEKIKKLEKEAKLLSIYKGYKNEIDMIYENIALIKNNFQLNVDKVDQIIQFFNENELVNISIFYNGELWDKGNDDKKVVISEDSYIHHVCELGHNDVLENIIQILKDKDNMFKDLLIYLLKSGPTSSKKIEDLQSFNTSLATYNKNDYVHKNDMIRLKENLSTNIKLIEELIKSYQDYINSL